MTIGPAIEPGPTQYEAFRSYSRFPSLDGLRAISVLMVITVHAGKHGDFVVWKVLDGSMGVPIFFVLSGFLITTLLLREQASYNVVSLKAFYVRRFMRLAPVYYLMLGAYLLITQMGSAEAMVARRQDFLEKLPLFLVYMNEYAHGTTTVFGHTWSLGIEEKFYLAWPSLAFVVLSTHLQRVIAAALLLLMFGILAVLSPQPHPFFGLSYGELLFGCVVALALHREATFERLRFLGRPIAHHIVVVGFVAFQLLPWCLEWRRTPLYGAFVALLFVSVLMCRSFWSRALDARPMRFVGQRSYSIYLVHVLGANFVDRLPLFAAGTWPGAIGAYLTNVALSLGAAELLYRFVERPCIRRGHAWSAAIQRTARGAAD